ncbi:MAG: choice-of-anchor D domain-containing protein, partial [Candidatus Sulfotelmatobacter sp.]
TGTGITSTLGFSATSLSFGNQSVGTTSAAQTITLSNTGTVAISMTSIAITGTNSGDFAQTNTCGTSLPVGAKCALSVTFTPAANGNRTASVTITDNAAGSPQTISLTGTGATLTVSLSGTSLNFGTQSLGTTTPAQTVTLTNTGNAVITFTKVAITSANSYDFTQTNTCGSSLAAGANCVFSLTFHPSAPVTRSGILTISDNASGSPQGVTLTGTGTAVSGVSLSPSSINFSSQNVYSASAAQTVTLNNTGSTALGIVDITATGDFAQTNTCNSPLAAGAHCTISVTFTPSATGARSGYITISDTDPTLLQTVNLSGTGQNPSATVTVSPVVASLTFSQTAQFQASINGLASSNVTWAVNGVSGGNSSIGTISASGLYTTPSSAGSYLIQATSIANNTQFADALIVVTNYAGVFTYHNDIARDGQNLNETVLTTGNVNTTQFGKLFSYPVDGKIYGQPLYVPNVSIPNQGSHNVVYVVTENDSIFAFDADGLQSTPLWQVSFLSSGVTPINEVTQIGCNNLGGQVGITSTPVFDPATNGIYLVAITAETAGSTTNFVQRLHALNVATGTELTGSPVVIQASVAGSGDGTDTVSFNALWENQRAGLLLLNGVVYIAWASHCDILPYYGWLMGYNGTSLQQVSVLNTNPNGGKGGIWQGGDAPAVDESNNMYIETGDGLFDTNTGGEDIGDSFLELTTNSAPAVTDYFTPSDQGTLDSENEDLGSCGPMVLPDQPGSTPHLVVGCDKLGRIFVLNRDDMGGYSPSGDNVFQEISGSLASDTRSVAAYWQNNVYFVSVNDFLKQFRLYNGMLSTTPVAQGLDNVSYPGATPTISANGSSNAIVWVLNSSNYATGGPAILYAYDAANTANRLYSSTQNASRDSAGAAVKFTVPTVANGRVYVPTASELDVYGLLP